MKKYINIALCAFLSALIGISCNTRAQNSETQLSKKDNETPKVYMFKEISPENLVKIYEALNRKATGKVAVKLSTGEPGGHNFLQPALIKDLVQKVNGTIVECNTLRGWKSRHRKSSESCCRPRFHGYRPCRHHGFGRRNSPTRTRR